ncbi:MAG: glycosyltransferase [Gemmatimonadaceae bacterium]
MRVIFLAHSFPRYREDSAGSFLLRLAVALREYETIQVHVIAPGAPGLSATEELDGVTVERYRYAPRRLETLAYTGTMAEDVRSSWTAKFALSGLLTSQVQRGVRAVGSFAADVIHAHWWFPAGLAGAAISMMARAPLVTTMHGSDVRLARGMPSARSAMRYILSRSQAITAVSSWLAREALDVAPLSQPVVAPMPVDTAVFIPPATTQRLDDQFLFVGRLNVQKGIDHLLRALAAMRTRATLEVVGDGPMRQEMERLAGSLNISDRIRWRGTVAHGSLPQHYGSSTALVVPSVEEGLGLVAAEAMLCGTPVIAYDSGGLPDIVRHEQTGLLVPPGDVPALASALDRLLARPDRGRSLGEYGRIHAISTFAPAAVAARYAAVYRAALGKQAS